MERNMTFYLVSLNSNYKECEDTGLGTESHRTHEGDSMLNNRLTDAHKRSLPRN